MQMRTNGVVKFISAGAVALSLSGCISYAMVSNTSSGHSVQKEWRSDTINGLSLAADSNGTKGYVFIGESLDYLLTKGGDDVVKLLNDPGINRQSLAVEGDTQFIIQSGHKEFFGRLALSYTWQNANEKERMAHYGFNCIEQRCTLTVDGLEGTIHKKNSKVDYSKMMAFYHPFKVGFYEYKSSGGIPQGVSTALLPITITLDIVTSPLQFAALYISSK